MDKKETRMAHVVVPGGLTGCLRSWSFNAGFKLCGPDAGGGLKLVDVKVEAVDAADDVSNALKADPSDGRPLGRLRDFARADDEST